MESRRIRQAAAAGFLLLAALASGALAQDLEPRSYSNAPIGLNFLIGGFLYTRGDVAVDASVEVTDARLQTRSAVLAYARSLDVWGRSAKFDVILPYTALDGQALVAGAPVKREVSGFGDPRFRFSINFYGAPALPPEKFAEYHQDLIIGASVQVTAPWGQYDPDKLVNLGTNRWSVKPELGASKAWGTWIVELSAAGMFFTDNDDFFGGNKRAQDPIYSAQAHIVHLLRSGIWIALDGTYYIGGRTTLNGVRGNDLQTHTRLGATIALPIDRYNSIKIYGSTGTFTRTGTDFDAVGIAWQYRWGRGF